MPKKEAVEIRFWRNVRKTGGCWLWQASTDDFGYGHLGSGRSVVRAHRLSWEIHFGAILGGLCVLHKCDTPACVRPDHLFLGTRNTNNKDRHTKGRYASQPFGEDHGRAKLTTIQVREIRAFKGIESQRELAKRFGVSRPTIKFIHQGKTWRHV